MAGLWAVRQQGWEWDVELRLDNKGAVSRGEGVGVWRGSAGAELTDGVLVETLSMSDPDIWVEVNRVKDRHGGHVRVKWHPGHPEKRKARDGSDWDMHDRAVFRADEIAEDAHKVRQPREASKLGKGQWRVLWRKQPLQGKINLRLREAIQIELLQMYVQKSSVETVVEWVEPEAARRMIQQKGEPLAKRVQRAKMLAGILGTAEVQDRRGQEVGGEAQYGSLCRLCGKAAETNSHVLWECEDDGAMVRARRELVRRVRTVFRQSGLSEEGVKVMCSIWALEPEGRVVVEKWEDLEGDLRRAGKGDLARIMGSALVKRSHDPTSLLLDRAGFLGTGWVELMVAQGLTERRARRVMSAVVKELLHGKRGVRCLWQRFCDQIGEGGEAVRSAAARGERKAYEDRITARLMAAGRWRAAGILVERVTRRTLQRGSTVDDLRVFLEAADQEADLPTAGDERERLEAELEAGLAAVKENRKVREAVGARQMQQLRESRRYGSLHRPKRQYVADRGTSGGKKGKRGKKGSKGEEERQRVPMRVVPRMLVENSQSEGEVFSVDSGTSSDGNTDSDLDCSDSGEGVAGSRAEGNDGGSGGQGTSDEDEVEEATVGDTGAAGRGVLGMGIGSDSAGEDGEGLVGQSGSGVEGGVSGEDAAVEGGDSGDWGGSSGEGGPQAAAAHAASDAGGSRGLAAGGGGDSGPGGGAEGMATGEGQLRRSRRVQGLPSDDSAADDSGRDRRGGGHGSGELVAGGMAGLGEGRNRGGEAREERGGGGQESAGGLRLGDAECGGAAGPGGPICPDRQGEVGLLAEEGVLGGERCAGSGGGAGRQGLGAGKGSGEEGARLRLGEATVHQGGALDVAAVQDLLEDRRVQQEQERLGGARVWVQGPQGRYEAASGQTQYEGQDGGGRGQARSVVATGGTAVGGAWGAVGDGEPGGQLGTQAIHEGHGGGACGETGTGGLLRIRQEGHEADTHMDISVELGAEGCSVEKDMAYLAKKESGNKPVRTSFVTYMQAANGDAADVDAMLAGLLRSEKTTQGLLEQVVNPTVKGVKKELVTAGRKVVKAVTKVLQDEVQSLREDLGAMKELLETAVGTKAGVLKRRKVASGEKRARTRTRSRTRTPVAKESCVPASALKAVRKKKSVDGVSAQEAEKGASMRMLQALMANKNGPAIVAQMVSAEDQATLSNMFDNAAQSGTVDDDEDDVEDEDMSEDDDMYDNEEDEEDSDGV